VPLSSLATEHNWLNNTESLVSNLPANLMNTLYMGAGMHALDKTEFEI
jgi:hypothetical protein